MGSAESIAFHFLEEKVKSKSIWKNVNTCQILMTMDVSVYTVFLPRNSGAIGQVEGLDINNFKHPSGL